MADAGYTAMFIILCMVYNLTFTGSNEEMQITWLYGSNRFSQ